MTDSIFTKDGTAQGVAKQRLIESLAKPNKRIIYDPYAAFFVAGASFIKLMGHQLSVWITKKFTPGFHEHLISRTRFIDDLVIQSTSEDIKQYVILGAGYDVRAHRLNLPPHVKIFEVDQPIVQQQKKAKLPRSLRQSKQLTYVSVDFNHQSLKEQLLQAGFNVNQPTLFTLEGVSQYITKVAVEATLKDIRALCHKVRTLFYMSYVDIAIKENPKACFGEGYKHPEKKVQTITYLAEKVGEPWTSFYSENELQNILDTFNFKIVENKTLADFNQLYFKPVGRTLLTKELFNLEHSLVAEYLPEQKI